MKLSSLCYFVNCKFFCHFQTQCDTSRVNKFSLDQHCERWKRTDDMYFFFCYICSLYLVSILSSLWWHMILYCQNSGAFVTHQRCALAFALEDNLTAADIRLIQSDVFSKVPISKSICHQISVKLLKRHYWTQPA